MCECKNIKVDPHIYKRGRDKRSYNAHNKCLARVAYRGRSIADAVAAHARVRGSLITDIFKESADKLGLGKAQLYIGPITTCAPRRVAKIT